jgi:hypothetical protein
MGFLLPVVRWLICIRDQPIGSPEAHRMWLNDRSTNCHWRDAPVNLFKKKKCQLRKLQCPWRKTGLCLSESCTFPSVSNYIRWRTKENMWKPFNTCFLSYLYRLCGLVVRVPCYRSRDLGFDSQRYQIFSVVGLERGPLSLVSTIDELLGRKSSLSGLDYGHRIPRHPLYAQKLALTSPTSGGRSVGIVRSWTHATEVFSSYVIFIIPFYLHSVSTMNLTCPSSYALDVTLNVVSKSASDSSFIQISCFRNYKPKIGLIHINLTVP